MSSPAPRIRKLLLIALASMFVVATAIAAGVYWTAQQTIQENVKLMKRIVTRDFHDPESARFRSVQLQSVDGSIGTRLRLIDLNFLWRSTPEEVLSAFRYDPESLSLCGEVNAKNGFGAYVGYKRFWVSGRKDPTPLLDTDSTDDFARKMCEIGEEGLVYQVPDPE